MQGCAVVDPESYHTADLIEDLERSDEAASQAGRRHLGHVHRADDGQGTHPKAGEEATGVEGPQMSRELDCGSDYEDDAGDEQRLTSTQDLGRWGGEKAGEKAARLEGDDDIAGQVIDPLG